MQMNMFLVHKVLGNEVADQQVLLFDKHPDGKAPEWYTATDDAVP
jgi:hypothetical protein